MSKKKAYKIRNEFVTVIENERDERLHLVYVNGIAMPLYLLNVLYYPVKDDSN